MNTRLKRRRERITKAILFYLGVLRQNRWTSNKDIIYHLDYSARGKSSYNAINPNSLGQLLRTCDVVERRITEIGNEKIVEYRMVKDEEE
tara:strand:- start:2952 stop:3221 length:270 start_codon:yes stop_codon:yes gene_type:complete